MSDFDKFVARHGEAAAQALIENMERYVGIRHHTYKHLCERWRVVMNTSSDSQRLAA